MMCGGGVSATIGFLAKIIIPKKEEAHKQRLFFFGLLASCF